MNCASCGDKGIIRMDWSDAPPDFALCLCDAGQDLRRTRNADHTVAPLWQVWCAREQVDPARVHRLEDVVSDEELRARGFARPDPASPASREAALLAAGKSRRPKL